MTRYYEDYVVGEKFVSPGKTVTEADISILMAIGRYNEPLMINEEYAKTTRFGGRIAPGPVVLLISGGLVAISGALDDKSVIAVSAINNVKFSNPLRAGDTLTVELELIDKKETSKADIGLITHREVCTNQKGERVIDYEEIHLIKRKPA